ncbi:PREDICTED: ubiquitin-like protein 7 [Hipposideros armiger]|uniref:Ubiquitin-like protein 7 n=1 Tax=Hipposideros armiger TaxID=186990 RepID=A0A8B7TCL1_HIPAR|nr:PREDICTED: ubiquitin-like protein 7 [Hipposideros armiger]
MTPPPPVCAALGIPRARLPSPRARSGLPLRLLLLLLGVAATTQGHPKSGPRISAIWKGGFLFEGLSDEEDDFHPSTRSTPSSSTPSSRPASLGYSGAAGPRPITQSELATALALASTPESSSHTPTPGTQAQPVHDLLDLADVGEHFIMADNVPVEGHDGWKETGMS